MMVEVPYSHMRGLDYPLVPITLDNRLKTLALVDSGASFSVFTTEVAIGLGLKIRKGKKLNIGGFSSGFPMYVHSISAEVAHHRFVCRIGFTEEPMSNINILGRDNFFHQFRITFDDRKRKMVLARGRD